MSPDRKTSLVQRLAFDGATTQQTAFIFGKVGACMDGAAVVPHHEIAQLPDVLEDKFAAFADLVELVQYRGALRGVEALDARRHQPVDEQRLAAGIRMSDEHRVKMVRYAADVARARCLPGAVVLVDVE